MVQAAPPQAHRPTGISHLTRTQQSQGCVTWHCFGFCGTAHSCVHGLLIHLTVLAIDIIIALSARAKLMHEGNETDLALPLHSSESCPLTQQLWF